VVPAAELHGGASSGGAPQPRRVAVFGGSFNPPHVAHVLAATYALSVAPIDEVLVVPVYRHPFSKELVPFEHRLAMCELSLGRIPGVSVSTVERELGGESLTLRTLEHLAATHPAWSMRLLVGADVVSDLPRWHRFDRIAELAPPIVLGRAGIAAPDAAAASWQASGSASACEAADVSLPQVSSTEARRALATGDVEAVRWRVPRAVLEYAVARGLYRSAP
jgi:nicotinate-nucleotide adenylyltransferase